MGQFGRQALQGPFARDVVLEGKLDERRSFGVRDDASHRAAANNFAHVEIPERSPVGETTQLGFLVLAFLDLAGKVGRVELSHQGVDTLDEAPRGGLLHVLGHRHESDAPAS